MTQEDLLFKVETKTPWEFKFKDVTYNLTYGKDKNGADYIEFGRLYEGERYPTFMDLMRKAKVENSFLREMLDVL